MQLIGALGAGVDDHDHDRRVPARAADERSRAGSVEQVRVEGVGGETEERHANPVRAQVGDLPREARGRDPGTIERGDRLRAA